MAGCAAFKRRSQPKTNKLQGIASAEGRIVSKESILAKQRASQAHIDAILSDDSLTFESFREHLRSFVMLKFALEPSDLEQTDDLGELAQASISKALKISKDLVADYEAGENCEGATSSDVKRTLLLVKIQKSLAVSLSLQELMQIETLEDIVRQVWPHLPAAQRSAELQSATHQPTT